MTVFTRSRELGDRLGDLLVRVAGGNVDVHQLHSLGAVVASSLFHPDELMLSVEDLEPIRPREWLVMWRQPEHPNAPLGPAGWIGRERTWPSEHEAVRHAETLERLAELTDEVRAVQIVTHCVELPATDWEEVGR